MILCFELNILDDLKIADHRNISLMQLANSFFSVSFNKDVSMSLYCYAGLAVIYVYKSSYCLFINLAIACLLQKLLGYLDNVLASLLPRYLAK